MRFKLILSLEVYTFFFNANELYYGFSTNFRVTNILNIKIKINEQKNKNTSSFLKSDKIYILKHYKFLEHNFLVTHTFLPFVKMIRMFHHECILIATNDESYEY